MADLAQKMGLGILAEGMQGPHSDTLDDKVPLFLIGRVIPSGWYCQEKVNYSKLFDAQMDGVVDLAAKKVSPRQFASNVEDLTRQTYVGSARSAGQAILHHKIIASMFWSQGNPMANPLPAARCQTAADQAALACALERYRLANGKFPETLEALTPRFIARAPNDVITGQPYKYRRANDGQFILYSVGWNEKDDGGVPGTALFDPAQGDWVWSYPAQ
jgi:hypothetical protein